MIDSHHRIPQFTGTSVPEYVGYLSSILTNLELQAETHIRWYTHKNPFGCWICDMLQLCRQLVDLYYPSPPLDNMNSRSSSEDIEIKRSVE